MAVLVLIVAIAGYFLFHAATDKTDYAGAGAGHPAAEGGKASDLSGPITKEEANKMRIPGRSDNMVKPQGNTNGGSGSGQ